MSMYLIAVITSMQSCFYRLNEALEPPTIDGQLIQSSATVHQVCLLNVLLWHPLYLLRRLLPTSNRNVWETCPTEDCASHTAVCRWSTGSSVGHSPRLLHGVNNIVLLVPAIYVCGNGHEVHGN